MTITDHDKLPLRYLCKAADTPIKELGPVLTALGFTVEYDTAANEVVTSRQEFGDFLRSASEGAL